MHDHSDLEAIRPAPYALPPGTPALQSPPWMRRTLLAVASALLCVAATAGYLVGRSRVPSPGDLAASAEAPGDAVPLAGR